MKYKDRKKTQEMKKYIWREMFLNYCRSSISNINRVETQFKKSTLYLTLYVYHCEY